MAPRPALLPVLRAVPRPTLRLADVSRRTRGHLGAGAGRGVGLVAGALALAAGSVAVGL